MSGNFGYMGRSNLLGDLDHMWRVGRYGGRNHVCNIWLLSVKGCGCGAKGNFALSNLLDASLLQHYHLTVCLPSVFGNTGESIGLYCLHFLALHHITVCLFDVPFFSSFISSTIRGE